MREKQLYLSSWWRCPEPHDMVSTVTLSHQASREVVCRHVFFQLRTCLGLYCLLRTSKARRDVRLVLPLTSTASQNDVRRDVFKRMVRPSSNLWRPWGKKQVRVRDKDTSYNTCTLPIKTCNTTKL